MLLHTPDWKILTALLTNSYYLRKNEKGEGVTKAYLRRISKVSGWETMEKSLKRLKENGLILVSRKGNGMTLISINWKDENIKHVKELVEA